MDVDYEINNGEQYFSIKELEVFQIMIEWKYNLDSLNFQLKFSII